MECAPIFGDQLMAAMLSCSSMALERTMRTDATTTLCAKYRKQNDKGQSFEFHLCVPQTMAPNKPIMARNSTSECDLTHISCPTLDTA